MSIALARTGGLALSMLGAASCANIATVDNGDAASMTSSPDPAVERERSASPSTTHLIEVEDGVALHIVDWGGDGPVLLFVPSWGATSHVFDGFAPRFTDSYRVLVMNTRGHGPSSRPDHGYTIERLTEDIADVLDALGVERATLLGLSRSESLTTQFAARYPDQVESLIYLSGPIDREYRRTFFQNPENRASAIQRSDADDVLLDLCGFDDSQPLPPGSNDDAADAVGQEWRDADPAPPYASITAPALSFWSPVTARVLQYKIWCADVEDQDAVDEQVDAFVRGSIPFFEIQAREMAIFQEQLTDAKLVVVPGATYYVYLSHPDLVEDEMRTFLSRAVDGG